MEQERESIDEKYSYVDRSKIAENTSRDNIGFRDDFAQSLAWNAGQYTEEDDYLGIDLNGEMDLD